MDGKQKETEKTAISNPVDLFGISDRHKEIDEAIEQVKRKNMQGIWFKEGFAIVNKEVLMEVSFGDWTFDKSEMSKENIRLKKKLNIIKEAIHEGCI